MHAMPRKPSPAAAHQGTAHIYSALCTLTYTNTLRGCQVFSQRPGAFSNGRLRHSTTGGYTRRSSSNNVDIVIDTDMGGETPCRGLTRKCVSTARWDVLHPGGPHPPTEGGWSEVGCLTAHPCSPPQEGKEDSPKPPKSGAYQGGPGDLGPCCVQGHIGSG